MKNYKKPTQVFFFAVAVAFFARGTNAEAGMVRIINNSDVAIKVNITPGTEGFPYCWKCLDSRLRSCGKQTAEIVVPVDALKGREHFSVIDIEDGFLASGKCKNLSVFKNYEVLFSDTTFGTSCKSREI
jgi:hypothetical protein